MSGATTSVLFVCLGNICRSPTAEGMFRAKLDAAGLADRVRVDSAGTGDWHVGDPPDPRMRAAASDVGIDLSTLRARQVRPEDLDAFAFVVAMDGANLAALEAMAPGRAVRMLAFLPEGVDGPADGDVPDPYFGGPDGFADVVALLDAATDGLLAAVRAELDGGRGRPSVAR